MAIDLRELVCSELNAEIPEDLLKSSAIDEVFSQTDRLFFNYRNKDLGAQTVTTDSSGNFTFTVAPIPDTVEQVIDTVTQCPVSFSYAKPTLLILQGVHPGDYIVRFTLATNPADLDELPHQLFQEIFIASIKRKLGQRIKFADFEEGPFKLDGEAIYDEGTTDYKELKEFLIINRDEKRVLGPRRQVFPF